MTMSEQERMVMHHHAIAVEWLCWQLTQLNGGTADLWRVKAFRHALLEWRDLPPDELRRVCDRNLAALKEAINWESRNDNEPDDFSIGARG